MFTQRQSVDRHAELRLLEAQLKLICDACSRIITIHAQTNLGKTFLRDLYINRIRSHACPFVVTDLSLGGYSPETVLTEWSTQLGSSKFRHFNAVLSEVQETRSRIDISRIIQLGNPQIQLNLNRDPEQRRLLIASLTREWFVDVQEMTTDEPLVVVIDAFNTQGTPKNPPTVDVELRQWIERDFLLHVSRSDMVRAAIFGQQYPKGNPGWAHLSTVLPLGPIGNPNEWLPLAKGINPEISLETLSAVCYSHAGVPGEIAAQLQLLEDWSYV